MIAKALERDEGYVKGTVTATHHQCIIQSPLDHYLLV